MTAHQITVMVCDGCMAKFGDEMVPVIRRSHRWSFWCEHVVAEAPDWHPGSQSPVLVYVGGKS
jgi:hypothetical protein